jgi:hypothetical protein
MCVQSARAGKLADVGGKESREPPRGQFQVRSPRLTHISTSPLHAGAAAEHCGAVMADASRPRCPDPVCVTAEVRSTLGRTPITRAGHIMDQVRLLLARLARQLLTEVSQFASRMSFASSSSAGRLLRRERATGPQPPPPPPHAARRPRREAIFPCCRLAVLSHCAPSERQRSRPSSPAP